MSENAHYSLYKEVPEGFNLLTASRDELDAYGIPRRPDADAEPSLFEFWKTLVSSPFSAKRPTFRDIHPPSLGSPLQSMLNWSGALVSTPWPKRFFFAAAGWTAPNVSLPSGHFTHSDDPKSLLWVGLDGHNGMLPKTSLPQIGTGHWPNGKPAHFAWWDWWRNPPEQEELTKHSPKQVITMIDNLAIDAGDKILAGLAVLASEDVLYFIKNQSTGEFRSFLAKRQPLGDIRQLGSSVEWVMERPTDPDSGKLFPLPAYEPVNFRYCLARAADGSDVPGRVMTLADNALLMQMRETLADPYSTVYVSHAALRKDPDGSIGVTCTFHDPT
ncbi:hypothetical protein JQ596_18650 [Bradyrhizobium manausense]|uniref:G1 family glutamic endopeptidase n=1 Tax=Bradyrhizobium TaxID=374 RepID=UPI001BA43C4B|nr:MULTISPECIES: G1 family glutamic endopeptidase [Bradyrhizobium]MBR0827549.1 hypothetical protein [Bradyrhizobium manausense]UVO26035.1 hypothetical protein KUF59_26110 [Bradyrhizobium arachidis]